MMYPGLVRGTPRRRPIPAHLAAPDSSATPVSTARDSLPPMPSAPESVQSESAPSVPAQRPASSALRQSPRRVPVPPATGAVVPVSGNGASGGRGPLSSRQELQASLTDLEAIADKFQNAEFNIAKVVAEATVFFGMLLLSWSIKLSRPKMVFAAAKVMIVIAFYSIYPVFAVVTTVILSCTYLYMRYRLRASK